METASRSWPAEVVEAIGEIAREINSGEIAVFCGAGVSRNSGLPVVNQFVPYVLLTLSVPREEVRMIEETLESTEDAKSRWDYLIKALCERMEISEGQIQRVMNTLPFEAFIETLANNTPIDKIFDIYDSEMYQPAVEPNTTHVFLAKLVAEGKVKTIVTTNFDQLIEKALKREGKIEGKDYEVLYREEEFRMINWAQDRVRLIKIHGSIHDKQAMAITLRQVAREKLSKARAGIIRHVFMEGKHDYVLILGYSCSDVFDLSPQIEVLKENLKAVWLVQHAGDPDVKDIREQTDKNPFRGFENSKRLYLDTDYLVKNLWDLAVHEPYVVNNGPANWKEKVDEWYATSLQRRTEAIKYGIPGRLLYDVGEWRAAIRYSERALATSKTDNPNQADGVTLANMGIAYAELGEYRKAINLFEKALEIFRRVGDVRGEARTLGNMGVVYANLGEYRKAIDLSEKALEIHRRMKDLGGEGKDLMNMGSAYADLGEQRKAIDLFEKVLEIYRRMGDVRGEGDVLGKMGIAYAKTDNKKKATECFQESRAVFQRLGLQNLVETIDRMAKSVGL